MKESIAFYVCLIAVAILVLCLGWHNGMAFLSFFGISVSEKTGHYFGLFIAIALIFSSIVILRYISKGAMNLVVGPDEE